MNAKTYGQIVSESAFEKYHMDIDHIEGEFIARAVILEFIRRVEESYNEHRPKDDSWMKTAFADEVALTRAYRKLSNEIKEAK